MPAAGPPDTDRSKACSETMLSRIARSYTRDEIRGDLSVICLAGIPCEITESRCSNYLVHTGQVRTTSIPCSSSDSVLIRVQPKV